LTARSGLAGKSGQPTLDERPDDLEVLGLRLRLLESDGEGHGLGDRIEGGVAGLDGDGAAHVADDLGQRVDVRLLVVADLRQATPDRHAKRVIAEIELVGGLPIEGILKMLKSECAVEHANVVGEIRGAPARQRTRISRRGAANPPLPQPPRCRRSA
jgi:hypothetical protein